MCSSTRCDVGWNITGRESRRATESTTSEWRSILKERKREEESGRERKERTRKKMTEEKDENENERTGINQRNTKSERERWRNSRIERWKEKGNQREDEDKKGERNIWRKREKMRRDQETNKKMFDCYTREAQTKLYHLPFLPLPLFFSFFLNRFSSGVYFKKFLQLFSWRLFFIFSSSCWCCCCCCSGCIIFSLSLLLSLNENYLLLLLLEVSAMHLFPKKKFSLELHKHGLKRANK